MRHENLEDTAPPEVQQSKPARFSEGPAEAEEAIEPDEDYVSPAMSRLERDKPRRAVVRRITEHLSAPPSAAAVDERLEALESLLTGIERNQYELAANLRDANLAFRRLAKRVDSLVERLTGRTSEN